MRERTLKEDKKKAYNFEEFYIYSFLDVSQHVILLLDSYEDILELLIQTYIDAYYMWEDIPEQEKQISWLKSIADDFAKSKWNVELKNTQLDLDDKAMFVDGTSVFLSIEERLSLLEEAGDLVTAKAKILSGFQGLLACVLLIAAVMLLITGIDKTKEKLEVLKEPFFKTLVDTNETESQQQEKDRRIQVGKKVVYLSDIGQVLYSLPFEESFPEMTVTDNPEIQKQAGWTYFLPCPDRKDTKLAEVEPSLYYTLYRMPTDGGNEIEIIAREVKNYAFWENNVYVEQFDRVQVIELNTSFEKQALGIYPEIKNQELYLHDTLGRTLKTDSDGKINFNDRILNMSSNRVVQVERAIQKHGGASYYFKNIEMEQSSEVYRNLNGKEEIFISQGIKIDSFCLVGDWIYYSVYSRTGGSQAHYSEIYKKPLVRDREPERVHKEFGGRIYQMYYDDKENEIYAQYAPRSWDNNYGVLAVISAGGQMSILNDKELRSSETTDGNDMLQFVLVYDNQVYCFWQDGVWNKRDNPVTSWRKVLVIPLSDRVKMRD